MSRFTQSHERAPVGTLTIVALSLAALALVGCDDEPSNDGDGYEDSSDYSDEGGSGDSGDASCASECEAACSEAGFAVGWCEAGQCVCDEPVDAACFNGVLGLCGCGEAAGEEPCTNDAVTQTYVACYTGYEYTTQIQCASEAVDITENTVNCEQLTACFDSGGEGGGSEPPACDPTYCSGTECYDGYCCSYFCSGDTCEQNCNF